METFSGRIAVIGSGKMGEILASGMVRSGVCQPDQIQVTDADPKRLADVAARHGFVAAAGNSQAAAASDVVILAVKPKDLPGVLEEVRSSKDDSRLIISIAAGVTTEVLEKGLGSPATVVRAMPNVASQVGEGVTAICAGNRAGEPHLRLARQLLEGVGPVIVIDEGQIDAVTAVSGSGPAYFALFAEAMVEAGVIAGLPRHISASLVAQTLRGTASLMTDGGMQAAEVREAVTSPGGTTAMAVRELERAGVRSAVMNAVQAALDRARALAGMS